MPSARRQQPSRARKTLKHKKRRALELVASQVEPVLAASSTTSSAALQAVRRSACQESTPIKRRRREGEGARRTQGACEAGVKRSQLSCSSRCCATALAAVALCLAATHHSNSPPQCSSTAPHRPVAARTIAAGRCGAPRGFQRRGVDPSIGGVASTFVLKWLKALQNATNGSVESSAAAGVQLRRWRAAFCAAVVVPRRRRRRVQAPRRPARAHRFPHRAVYIVGDPLHGPRSSGATFSAGTCTGCTTAGSRARSAKAPIPTRGRDAELPAAPAAASSAACRPPAARPRGVAQARTLPKVAQFAVARLPRAG